MGQPVVVGPETVPEPPAGWGKEKSPRAQTSPRAAAPAAGGPRGPAASVAATKGSDETVLAQTTGLKGSAAVCKKCGEATGDSKFCPVCGELQGGPTGSLGGIVSPRAKGM